MKSISKVLGILIVALLVLVVAAGFTLTHVLDPNDYKEEIRTLVRDKANIDLQINGDIGWSLFPWLGLEVTDVQAAQADTPEQPFADIRLLALSVRVLPLLSKEIQMSDVRLDGLNLNLIRDAQGNTNWEGQSTPAATTTPAPEQPSEKQPSENSPAFNFDIDSLIVNSARIDYRDEQTQQHFTLENLQITTGAITTAKDIPVKLSGFVANASPLIRARMDMTAKLNIDLESKQYQVKDLVIAGEVAGDPFKGKSANIGVRGNMFLDQSAQTGRVEQLRLSINQFKLMTDISLTQLDKNPTYQGQLSIANVNLREFLPSIGIKLPASSNNKALTSFELSGQISGNSSAAALNETRIKLDQTTIEGSLASKNLAQAAMSIKLSGDQINLDDYLPPASKQAAASTETSTSVSLERPLPASPTENPWSTDELLPLASLRSIVADADIKFQQVQLKQLPLRDLQVKAQANQGMLELKKFSARLYEGSINTQANLNAKTDNPQFNLKADVKNIPAEKLLAALEQDPLLEGNINLNVQLNSRGNSQRSLVANLNGNSTYDVTNGKITTVNVDQYLCTAISLLNRKSMTTGFTSHTTPFTRLGGQLTIRDGVLHNSDTQVSIPGLRIKGKGDVNLNLMGLDYVVGITLLGDTREMSDPACAINERYVGLEIPFRCRGPLMNGKPSCSIDEDGFGKIAARLAGNKLTEKLDEKLGEKVSPDLKDALKGLFR